MGTWDPSQYERFQSQRAQPFRDLVQLLEPTPAPHVVDLGCGTGELTSELHESLGAGQTLGLDNSVEMLSRAQGLSVPGLSFHRGSIEDFRAERTFDVVFSNAALHWCADHPRLLEKLTSALRPGGQLAVQVPANVDHPAHRLAEQVFQEEPFRSAARAPTPPWPVLPPREYAEQLFRLGFVRQHVRLQIYGHVLPSAAEVVEWTKGTLLTGYEDRLPPDVFPRFVETYRARVEASLGTGSPYFYGFARILMWARLPT
jgi:trans-aconitate 2-methyltransferase